MKARSCCAIALVTVVLAFLACGSPTEPEQAVPFNTIHREELTGLATPVHRLITTPEEWQSFWTVMESGFRPLTAPPAVDFSREVVVVASMTYVNRRAEVEIGSIRRSGDRLTVEVRETSPGDNCGQLPATSAPVHVVSLARDDYTASFRVTRVARACS